MNRRITVLELLIWVLIYLSLTCPVELKSDDLNINWNKLKQSWEEFLNYPSGNNLNNIYNILPQKLPKDTRREILHPQLNAQVIEFIWNNLSMLEREIYASNRNAVKVAFRLQIISDGYYSEILDMILGQLIRINPKMFLEELKNHRDVIVRLDALVGNHGIDYVDKEKAQYLETLRRIKALDSVNTESLKKVKSECLKELINEKNTFEKMFEYDKKKQNKKGSPLGTKNLKNS